MLSRRTFVKTLGAGGAGALTMPLLAAHPREIPRGVVRGELAHETVARWRALAPGALRLDSNENPLGPSPAAVARLQGMMSEASRYPFEVASQLRTAVAHSHRTDANAVVLGCGSSEVLRMAVLASCSPSRALVTISPSFEDPVEHAQRLGAAVRAVPVRGDLSVDLDAMAGAARGAGLVFLCNPNNPTGGVHAAADVTAFIDAVQRAEPDATILVDEAYHEYVDAPGYATAVPVALARRGVIVSRTFSKAFGMAGLRAGYAIGHPETVARLEPHRLGINVNVLAAAAALGSLGDTTLVERERARNRAARDAARRWFESAGYRVAPATANFLMVDVRRPAGAFQEECARRGVLVGRPFPPLAERWARVSVGTEEEMRAAVDVFGQVLRARG